MMTSIGSVSVTGSAAQEEKRPRNSDETFIKVWNASASKEEAAKTLGITIDSLNSRKSALLAAAKAVGIELPFKSFDSRRKPKDKVAYFKALAATVAG